MFILNLLAQVDPVNVEAAFGTVAKPPGVGLFDAASQGDIGLLYFISSIIKIATMIAGLYVLFNFITAGYDYITAGDATAHQKIRQKLTNSILGLVIIVFSYTLIGVIGFVFFGRADYILNPQICGPGVCP